MCDKICDICDECTNQLFNKFFKYLKKYYCIKCKSMKDKERNKFKKCDDCQRGNCIDCNERMYYNHIEGRCDICFRINKKKLK